MRPCLRALRLALAMCLVALAAPAGAQPAPVRLILDWAPQPHQSPWFLAADRGHFARENLAVTVDRGFGSGDGMNKVAAGAYDVALGDANLLLQWNAQNPQRRLLLVFLYMDRGLQGVVTLRSRNITALPELAGKRVARTTGDIIGPLWPLFSRLQGIDSSRIEWVNVQPNLRDSLLVRGGVDAVTAFTSTAYFNLLALGARREEVIVFPLAEHGLELFGNGLIVTAEYAERHGEVLRRLLRATVAGMQDALADQPAAVASVLRRDQTADARVEADRFRFMIERAIITPGVRERGISEPSPERLARVTGILAEAFELASPPPVESFYSAAFLPPLAERRLRP
jgi:NitT/TauT family transport system substrate-binding protein